jgi:type II secretory pathway pseudopilin PulG
VAHRGKRATGRCMRVGSRRARSSRCQSRGFTFLWVLFSVAIVGIGLLAVSEVWVVTVARQKRVQFEWVGAQYRQAIGSYYELSRSGAKEFPVKLEDLLVDPRYPTTRRHLRAFYTNPFTGLPDWELVRSGDGRIRGVRAPVPEGDGSRLVEFVYAASNAS